MIDKGLISKIHKQLIQLNTKKTKQPNQNMGRRPNSHFFKEDIQRTKRYMKRLLIIREMQIKTTVMTSQSESVQFSSVAQSCPTLCDPMNHSTPVLGSITNSQSLLRLMSIESVMPSSHLILCRPLLLLPPIPPRSRVFSNESTLLMSWPKYWSFSFSISPSKEIPGLISFRADCLC